MTKQHKRRRGKRTSAAPEVQHRPSGMQHAVSILRVSTKRQRNDGAGTMKIWDNGTYEVRKAPSRGAAIDEMIRGCKVLVRKLYDEGRIHGAISFGGAEGGVMAATAMQVLPPGFPKIVITPLASGIRPFGPFVGIRDMMVMHSLIDIVGINDISRSIFDNASAAIIGMAKNYRPMEIRGKKNVALTALGTVQKAINFICPQLVRAGYQPIIFHASGVGGRIMEDFIERRTFCGVIDLSPNELTDHITGGFHNAGPHRLEAAGKFPRRIVVGEKKVAWIEDEIVADIDTGRIRLQMEIVMRWIDKLWVGHQGTAIFARCLPSLERS